MTAHYIPRSLEPVLAQALREFPVVVLVGPRQSGKTTLLAHTVGARIPVISLEPPDVRAAAEGDPRRVSRFLRDARGLRRNPIRGPSWTRPTSRSEWTPAAYSAPASIS